MQGLLMQKQGLQIELNQVDNALEELGKSDDDVYKIISGIMIKSDKKRLGRELGEKKAVFEGKISAMEKQEELLEEQAGDLRKDFNKKTEKNQ